MPRISLLAGAPYTYAADFVLTAKRALAQNPLESTMFVVHFLAGRQWRGRRHSSVGARRCGHEGLARRKSDVQLLHRSALVYSGNTGTAVICMPGRLHARLAERIVGTAMCRLNPTPGNKILCTKAALKQAILAAVDEAHEIGFLAGQQRTVRRTYSSWQRGPARLDGHPAR